MEKQRIVPIPEQELAKKILEKESLTHEDIAEDIAQKIVDRLNFAGISDEEKASVIIKSLEKNALWKLIGAKYSADVIHPGEWNLLSQDEKKHERHKGTQLNPEDLDHYLLLLRKRIEQALRQKMVGHDIQFLDLALNEAKRQATSPISSVDADATTRPPPTRFPRGQSILEVGIITDAAGNTQVVRDTTQLDHEHTKIQLTEALKILETALALEHNAHLIPIQSYDPKTGSMRTKHEGTLVTLLDLENEALNHESDASENKRRRAKLLINILRDAMDGAAYLARHNLILQDIKPGNIGMVTPPETSEPAGVLFDYDGLTRKEAVVRANHLTVGYIPPEIQADPSTNILPSQMAYQFGVTLKEILPLEGVEWTAGEHKDLQALTEKLMGNARGEMPKPEDAPRRIALDAAVNELDRIMRESAARPYRQPKSRGIVTPHTPRRSPLTPKDTIVDQSAEAPKQTINP
ncbi:hypothetical protein HYV73_04110 [Candidatus Uhrbacteria bacterium]|nr:hypothetical protein [Candidatus Uhrbacteria bacterium]